MPKATRILCVLCLIPCAALAKSGSVDYSWGADALASMHDFVVTMMLYVLYVCYAVTSVFAVIAALQIYIKMNTGEEGYGLDDDTLLVTHDSVRPFLTHRIIEENIEYGQKYDAVDTVIPATDTIVASENGEIISDVPDRSKMYQGQTPQTFRAKKLKDLYYSLSDEEKGILTDASKIFVMKGEKVHLVQGEVFNIKITYPYDLRVAESLIRNGEMDK